MDTPITGLWSELQRENKLPKGALSVNCEPELQELMKQIDKLVAGKKREWEREREGLASRLNVREQENQMQKTTLEQKHKEIGQLRVQLDSSENKQRDLVSQYENQLSSLRAEVQNLKREYERLHKRYSKHKRESEKEREKSTVELQGGMQEVHKLNKKVEEYRQRSRDWEIDRRSLQKQVENLEAQRKAIADKCEFVQNSKVDKLKGSLEEAMDSHKKAMDDNERLLNDLKKANAQCRKLEDLNAELQGELRARDDFLQMSEEDSRQHENNIAVLNKQIQKKDDIIKSLSDTRCQTEDETITTLRKTVDEVQDQARLSKRNEDLLGQENRQLQQELGIKRDDCENMERKLHQKRIVRDIKDVKQDVARLEEEVATVKLQLSAAEEKLSSINVHHEAELITIKEQLSKVSNELESSSTNLGDVGARARDLEEQVTDGRGEIKKRDAELKVANAQIEALRLENRHLRQTIIQQTQVNLDHTETETQLREMQQTYQAQIKSLEKDNVSLRDELGVMRQEVTALEDRFDHQLQRTIHEAEMSHTEELSREQRHLQDLEEDADRRVSMLQDRLDSTINRYEEQLTLLRRQKARVEDDLDRERRAGSSFRQGDIVIEEGEEGVIYVNDDMSLADTDSGNEMNFGIPASEKFLNEEAARTRQLESIIDCHIQTLKSSSDMAIKKHKR
ncbi:centrosomal protein of 63 kDa-like isoform X4 [Mya arenaria]|uniref:centrosomal protein of 63 kDa-like isoform X4 n=1 Tax=Mya arenaria TaxID=6604 RepID=UPI0022E41876|nr:centrosomal protein of 63 kDa-like isoform X4 [Mya arenaria]